MAPPLSRLGWKLRTLLRKVWVRATFHSLVAVVAALVAALLGPLVPDDVAGLIGDDTVERILGIMASSMLSVTIFALSTMVGAFASAGNASPRATRLVTEDVTAQTLLANFLGIFLFSLVAIIALETNLYDAGGRFVLFLTTLALVGLTVLSLIRWIQHITKLGRLGETTDRVEHATRDALEAHRRRPYLGGVPWDSASAPPPGARAIAAPRIGYVRHLDVLRLGALLPDGARILVTARPGAFVGPGRGLGFVLGAEELSTEALAVGWTIGDTRSYDQDPRFGLCVLAEVASKALSPGINDAGTAIDVLGRLTRIFGGLTANADADAHEIGDPRIWVPALGAEDLLEDAFRPIARDGAGNIELMLRLLATLDHLHAMRIPSGLLAGDLSAGARRLAEDAVSRALETMSHAADRDTVSAALARR